MPEDRLLNQEKDSDVEYTPEKNKVEVCEYVEEMVKKQNEVFQTIEKNLDTNERKYIKRHNIKAKSSKILPGDRVYIKSIIPPKKSKKLYKYFEGPYRILESLGNERYKLQDMSNGKTKLVHSRNIKSVPETARQKRKIESTSPESVTPVKFTRRNN